MHCCPLVIEVSSTPATDETHCTEQTYPGGGAQGSTQVSHLHSYGNTSLGIYKEPVTPQTQWLPSLHSISGSFGVSQSEPPLRMAIGRGCCCHTWPLLPNASHPPVCSRESLAPGRSLRAALPEKASEMSVFICSMCSCGCARRHDSLLVEANESKRVLLILKGAHICFGVD